MYTLKNKNRCNDIFCDNEVKYYVKFNWSRRYKRYCLPQIVDDAKCDKHNNRSVGETQITDYYGDSITITQTTILDQTKVNFYKKGKIAPILNLHAGKTWNFIKNLHHHHITPSLFVRVSDAEQGKILGDKYPCPYSGQGTFRDIFCRNQDCQADYARPKSNIIIFSCYSSSSSDPFDEHFRYCFRKCVLCMCCIDDIITQKRGKMFSITETRNMIGKQNFEDRVSKILFNLRNVEQVFILPSQTTISFINYTKELYFQLENEKEANHYLSILKNTDLVDKENFMSNKLSML